MHNKETQDLELEHGINEFENQLLRTLQIFTNIEFGNWIHEKAAIQITISKNGKTKGMSFDYVKFGNTISQFNMSLQGMPETDKTRINTDREELIQEALKQIKLVFGD